MCEFQESNCNRFRDMWWTDKCTDFSSIDVEQQRGKDAALWKAILLPAPSAAFADEVHIKASV